MFAADGTESMLQFRATGSTVTITWDADAGTLSFRVVSGPLRIDRPNLMHDWFNVVMPPPPDERVMTFPGNFPKGAELRPCVRLRTSLDRFAIGQGSRASLRDSF